MGGALTRMLGRTATATGGGPFTTSGFYGLPDAAGTGDYIAGAELDLRQITAWAGANASLTGIACYLGSIVVNGAKIKPVLYADSGSNTPGSLIAVGTEYIILTADATTTHNLSFSVAQTLTAGTKYWIGWITDSASRFRAVTGAGNGTKWANNTYASGAPASAPAMTNSVNTIVSKGIVSVAVGVAGYWDQETQQDYNLAANEVDLISITTPASGTCSADSLVIRLGGTVTVGGKMKGVIYSDNAGSPDALVATGTEVTVAAINTELTSTFSSVTLSANTTYWIGCHSDNASHMMSKAGTTKWKAATYASGPPGTISSPSSSAFQAGFYLRYS